MTQEELTLGWLELRSVKREIDRKVQLGECRESIIRLQGELLGIGDKIQAKGEEREHITPESPDERLLTTRLRQLWVEMQKKNHLLQEARIREGELRVAETQTEMTERERVAWIDDLVAIQCMPLVQEVTITVERLVVRVGPIIVAFGSKRFDLGDYNIDVATTPGIEELVVRCVRRSSEKGIAHPYGSSFCFGVRGVQIALLQRRGAYRQLIELALECVCHVNPGDEHKVTDIYKEITDVGIPPSAPSGDSSRGAPEDTGVLPNLCGGD